MSNNKSLPKKTLNITHPELLKDWDQEKNGELSPSDFVPGSRKRVHWCCNICGYNWMTTIEHRALDKTRCPACSGRKPRIGINDFATLYPRFAAEWDFNGNDGHLPSEYLPKSNYKASWKCKRGHIWITRISTRVSFHTHCPYCSGNRPIKGETDLATTHPELLKEWDFEVNSLTPQDVMAGSDKKVFWRCEHGHKWKASISNRVHGRNCPYCNHKRPWPGETDLVTVYPDVVNEWDYKHNGNLIPEQFLPRSGKRVFWICNNCGLSYRASIYDHCVNGHGCPYDAGKKPIPGKTDLVTTHPKIAAQWHTVLNRHPASHYTAGSNQNVWWHCQCGKEWMAQISSRVHQDTACPKCRRYP